MKKKIKKPSIEKLNIYWGDIALFVVIPLLFIVSIFTPSGGWFAALVFLLCLGAFSIAIIRVAVYKKQKLRDLQYLVGWIFPIIVLIPFVFFWSASDEQKAQHFAAAMKGMQSFHRGFYSFRMAIYFYKIHEEKSAVKTQADTEVEGVPPEK